MKRSLVMVLIVISASQLLALELTASLGGGLGTQGVKGEEDAVAMTVEFLSELRVVGALSLRSGLGFSRVNAESRPGPDPRADFITIPALIKASGNLRFCESCYAVAGVVVQTNVRGDSSLDSGIANVLGLGLRYDAVDVEIRGVPTGDFKGWSFVFSTPLSR